MHLKDFLDIDEFTLKSNVGDSKAYRDTFISARKFLKSNHHLPDSYIDKMYTLPSTLRHFCK